MASREETKLIELGKQAIIAEAQNALANGAAPRVVPHLKNHTLKLTINASNTTPQVVYYTKQHLIDRGMEELEKQLKTKPAMH